MVLGLAPEFFHLLSTMETQPFSPLWRGPFLHTMKRAILSMSPFDLLSGHGSGSAQNLSVTASEMNSRNSGICICNGKLIRQIIYVCNDFREHGRKTSSHKLAVAISHAAPRTSQFLPSFLLTSLAEPLEPTSEVTLFFSQLRQPFLRGLSSMLCTPLSCTANVSSAHSSFIHISPWA